MLDTFVMSKEQKSKKIRRSENLVGLMPEKYKLVTLIQTIKHLDKMKKTILAIAVLVGVSTANLSIAADKVKENNASIELVSGAELKFKLSLENVKERSSLVIKDYTGTIVYSTSLPKSENYSKIFDLSNLADGNYSFVINNGSEISTKPFAISTETKRQVTAVIK
jgi:hypothetical protein